MLFHVITYWTGGLSQYHGSFASAADAIKLANTFTSPDADFRVTIVKF